MMLLYLNSCKWSESRTLRIRNREIGREGEIGTTTSSMHSWEREGGYTLFLFLGVRS